MSCLPVAVLLFLIHTSNGEFSKPPQPPLFVKKMEKLMELKFGPINRFVLECTASAEPAPTYTWFKNGERLADESAGIKLISDEDHSQLEFSSPAPEHEGFYHCVAENDYGKAKSTVVHVTSKPPTPSRGTSAPVFQKGPEIELLRAGNTAKFNCLAEGTPEPEIVWLKNGEVIPGETGSELVIHNIGSEDVANYACNASNSAGYDYKDAYLNILTVSAVITTGPQDQIVSKGSNVTMKCETDGFPDPTVEWFLNLTKITPSDKYSINKATGDLVIFSAKAADQGTYRCEARNHGKSSKEGNLVVKSKTEIINGPRDLSVQVFSEVTMNCSVVSDLSEKLTVIWKKNNVDLGQNVYSGDQRISQDENYSLVIRNVTLDDEGTYTCVAFTESTVSNPATDSGLLSVSGIPPVLSKLDSVSEQIMLEESETRLACQVLQGYEAPKVSWFKDGLPLETSEDVEIQPGGLSIKQTRPLDSGDYACKAVNSWGSDSVEFSVLVRHKTKILSGPVYVEYSHGTEVLLDCPVEVDPALKNSLEISWFKGDQLIEASSASYFPSESDTVYDYDPEEEQRFYVHANHSLEIRGLQEADIGLYKCEASTELEPLLRSEPSEIYLATEFPFWIIILIVIIIILIVIILCCFWRLRKRQKGKGYYGVKDIEKSGGKHNKSDIYYTTEDGDSIMNEQDNLPLNSSTPTRTPIFTPKTIRHLSNMDKSTGSVGSLLEDDEFLKRGMDEDGSFRERYAD